MIFSDTIDEVKRRLARSGMSAADIDPYVKRWINSALKTIAGEASWKDLRKQDTISTVDGTEEYVLPIDFGNMAFVWHRLLGYNYRLLPIPERKFVNIGFIGTTEGIPYWYRLFSTKSVLAQPTSASVIKVVSSDADDDAVIRIEGVVSGYPDAESLTLNGTTAVSGTKQFTEIFRISKSEATEGRITVTSNNDVITVAVLPAGLLFNTLRRKWIRFYYIPDTTGDTINIYYYQKVFKLVDDNDAPPFDEDFDELIILKACQIGMGFEEGNLDKAKKIWLDYRDELARLRKDNLKDDDWKPLLESFGQSANVRRVLNFGPYYPFVRL